MIDNNALGRLEETTFQSSLEMLLDFFVFQEETKSLYQYFEELDEFLAVTFNSEPLVVIAAKGSESYRIVFNENAVGDEYPSRDMLILNTFLLENQKKNNCSYNRDGYYIFLMGQESDERFWGFLKINRKNLLKAKTYDYFIKLVQKSFCYLIQASDLEKSNELIFSDDITGLYNHRRLRFDIEELVKNFHENCEVFSVLFIDIDRFKNVNDGNGHLIGTELLRQLGVALQRVVCESHMIYRYGGDEFVVLLPKFATFEAKAVAERVLKTIQKKTFDVNGVNFELSVSIGVSCFPKDARTSSEILDAADKMMYHAKKNGRGQVSLTSELFD